MLSSLSSSWNLWSYTSLTARHFNMCSIHLLPSMLGGVTPASVIQEILCEAEWTLSHNYGAASQRHARGRFVLWWKVWWILGGFAFCLDYQVDGKLATGGIDNARYTNFESTSHCTVNPDGLNPNDAAVETEFVITVPFLGYYSTVLENPLAFSPSSCWHGLQVFQQ